MLLLADVSVAFSSGVLMDVMGVRIGWFYAYVNWVLMGFQWGLNGAYLVQLIGFIWVHDIMTSDIWQGVKYCQVLGAPIGKHFLGVSIVYNV